MTPAASDLRDFALVLAVLLGLIVGSAAIWYVTLFGV